MRKTAHVMRVNKAEPVKKSVSGNLSVSLAIGGQLYRVSVFKVNVELWATLEFTPFRHATSKEVLRAEEGDPLTP